MRNLGDLRGGSTPASSRLGYSDYLDDDGMVLSAEKQAEISSQRIKRRMQEQGVQHPEQLKEA